MSSAEQRSCGHHADYALVGWSALAKLPAACVSSFVQPAVAIDRDPLSRVLGDVYVRCTALEDRQQTGYSHPQFDLSPEIFTCVLGTSWAALCVGVREDLVSVVGCRIEI